MTTEIKNSSFISHSGVREDFFTAFSVPQSDFTAEAEKLLADYDAALAEYDCSPASEVLLRFHLSDVTNQQHILEKLLANRRTFISIVGQTPANNSRLALEAWHWQSVAKEKGEDHLLVKLENYQVAWFNKKVLNSTGSYDQTAEEFAALKEFLAKSGANTADHTIRTWLYCRDVDNNYSGLVQARNAFFAENGLTRDTHFIASTGIEGKSAIPRRLIRMDSINIPGLENGQMKYLYALDMLSPTTLYGVSFERGTRVVYGDRSHIFISGTASIDHQGRVVHLFDVANQTRRMLDNIEALLSEAEAGKEDIKIAALYLRDPADAPAVQKIIAERFGSNLPLVTVKAPVCRPEWLVEMECIAVNGRGNNKFKNFK